MRLFTSAPRAWLSAALLLLTPLLGRADLVGYIQKDEPKFAWKLTGTRMNSTRQSRPE